MLHVHPVMKRINFRCWCGDFTAGNKVGWMQQPVGDVALDLRGSGCRCEVIRLRYILTTKKRLVDRRGLEEWQIPVVAARCLISANDGIWTKIGLTSGG